MDSSSPVLILQSPECAPPSVVIDADAPSPVQLAAADFEQDALEATGSRWKLQQGLEPSGSPVKIYAGVVGESGLAASMRWMEIAEIASLEGQWDAFVIYPTDEALAVAGSNSRGVMYGLYALSEMLFGTDPMKAFSGVRPEKLQVVQWDGGCHCSGEPKFRYRGIFINDEDALMSWRGEAEDGLVAPEVHAMIIETVCRLRGNLLAPPMWAGYMDTESRELVEARGLFYTASHLEVLLSNPQNYWDQWCREKLGRSLPYSFSRYPDQLAAYWRETVRRHKGFNNIWPVGLRGVTDCALWVSDPSAPDNMADRARLVSEAVTCQSRILREELPGEPVVMSLTMRDEVLELFETGELKLPPEVILVWDDLARKSLMRRLPGPADRDKASLHGVYYHLNYCQNPRMQYLPARLLNSELGRVTEAGASEYLLFNAGNVREIALLLRWAMKLAWNPDPYIADPEGGHRLVMESVLAVFGEEVSGELTALYEDFLEMENAFRVSQVADCLGPLITSHDLYDIWDNTSALDWIQEKGSVRSVAEYAGKIHFDNLPERCWCFDPERLPAKLKDWQSLHARVEHLRGRIPERARAFYDFNLRLQVLTSLGFCEWAIAVLEGFKLCRREDFDHAADEFEKGARALERLEDARAESSTGKWLNWFRGEYSNVFKKSLWTLKPRWHAEDTQSLAELLRSGNGTRALPLDQVR